MAKRTLQVQMGIAQSGNLHPVLLYRTNKRYSGSMRLLDAIGTIAELELQIVISNYGQDAVIINSDTADIVGKYGDIMIVERKGNMIGNEYIMTNACYVAFRNRIIPCGIEYPVEGN